MLRLPQTAALLVLIGLAGCRPSAPPENQAEPGPNATAEQAPPPILQPERPLDRESVLLAAIKARSAAASGADDGSAQAELDGKRFEFRIALGCSLAPAGEEGVQATFDPERRRVELSVRADAALTDPAVAAAAAGEFEAAEGFWIVDPWLLVPHCWAAAPDTAPPADAVPPATEGAAPASAAEPDRLQPAHAGGLALVQFFSAGEPRTERRNGRPYAARQVLPEGDAAPAPGSWELVLTGRLQALGNGKVVACSPVGAGATPACVVSVRLDRVAIQNRASGERLAEWGSR